MGRGVCATYGSRQTTPHGAYKTRLSHRHGLTGTTKYGNRNAATTVDAWRYEGSLFCVHITSLFIFAISLSDVTRFC